ncbi:MAG: radical SAM protein [Planctomycetota bacterium]|nr:radical SAM protein [Planctomycetota bacterium]
MSLLKTIRILRMFRPLVGRVPAGHLWYLYKQMRQERPHVFAGQIRVNTFFPPFPSEAFGRFCDHVIARRRVPYSAYLAVTSRCPFRCGHCSLGGRKAAELTGEQWRYLIAQLRQLGVCTVGFTGGEPLMRADLEQLIAAATAAGMATIVFTTGAGLDLTRAAALAAAGATCVTVGIEADDAPAQDRVRGRPGSLGQARAALEACRREGVYTAVSTIGFAERIANGQIERMYELAARWGAGEFRLLSPVATGAIAGCDAASLTDEQVTWLREFHERHNRDTKGPVVASFARLESADMFGCGAGYHHVFIDSGGEVCPCDLTPLSFGNAAAEGVAAVWGRMAEHFPLPRCGCLMKNLTRPLEPGAGPLPLPPEQSAAICPKRSASDRLPGAYERLMK